jgi:hypothetical protein
MTVETSLRKRARRSRLFAAFYALSAVTCIGLGMWFIYKVAKEGIHLERTIATLKIGPTSDIDSTPSSTDKQNPETNQSLATQTLLLASSVMIFLTACFAAFFLLRVAYQESYLCLRYDALADALCLSGNSLDALEKAASILVPRDGHFVRSDVVSSREVKVFMDIVKSMKG